MVISKDSTLSKNDLTRPIKGQSKIISYIKFPTFTFRQQIFKVFYKLKLYNWVKRSGKLPPRDLFQQKLLCILSSVKAANKGNEMFFISV